VHQTDDTLLVITCVHAWRHRVIAFCTHNQHMP